MTWGFGKVILLGEHAVVYGQPAVAGAVDRGVRMRAATCDGASTLTIPAWDLAVSCADEHPVADALRALLDAAAVGRQGLALHADVTLPAAAGLGSSAAVAVAMARAVAPEAPAERIEEIADAAERCFHGNPSGIDVALATRGGLGLYTRDDGLAPIDAAPVPIVVALSGEPRTTADMVARVKAAVEGSPRAMQRIEDLGACATRAARALSSGAVDRLGGLLGRAHGELASLGVSTPVLDALVEGALIAGASGAKLTGAGGGGAVIAYGPGREDEVLERWTAMGYQAFTTMVGATSAPESDT